MSYVLSKQKENTNSDKIKKYYEKVIQKYSDKAETKEKPTLAPEEKSNLNAVDTNSQSTTDKAAIINKIKKYKVKKKKKKKKKNYSTKEVLKELKESKYQYQQDNNTEFQNNELVNETKKIGEPMEIIQD